MPPRTTAWTGDDVLEIDGIRFVSRPMVGQFSSTSDRFCLVKRGR